MEGSFEIFKRWVSERGEEIMILLWKIPHFFFFSFIYLFIYFVFLACGVYG